MPSALRETSHDDAGREAPGGGGERRRDEIGSRVARSPWPFRVFMAGSVVSWVGDWMDLTALNWAVLELTGSALDLGLINVCRLAPVFALSLPAGVLADRYERRRLLLALTTGTMLLTFVVASLVMVRAPFGAFAAAVTARSALAAMIPPVRNALLPNLVPQSVMSRAVASQAAWMNLSRIAGPAIAGALLAALPMPAVFWVNGASFLAVLATLLVVQPKIAQAVGSGPRSWPAVKEAFAFVRRDAAVQTLLVLSVVPMIFGFPYTALMPLFARDLLGLGPAGFGLLLSVAGGGALLGSGWLSLCGHSGRAGPWLVASTIGFGLALLLFTGCRTFLSASLAIFLVGLAGQIYRTTGRIALQRQVPDRLRGRILSIALMDRGLIPLGAMLLSAIAEWAGTVWAGVVMGGGCILATLALMAVSRSLWRI